MNTNKSLQEALDKQDVSVVHSILYSILLSDPGFCTDRFDSALSLAIQHSPIVLDDFDGEQLKNESEWNIEYYDLLASKLIDNFSMERIEQLKKVARVVYPNSASSKPVTVSTKPAMKQTQSNISTPSYSNDHPQKSGMKAAVPDDKAPYLVFAIGVFVVLGMLLNYLFRKDENK